MIQVSVCTVGVDNPSKNYLFLNEVTFCVVVAAIHGEKKHTTCQTFLVALSFFSLFSFLSRGLSMMSVWYFARISSLKTFANLAQHLPHREKNMHRSLEIVVQFIFLVIASPKKSYPMYGTFHLM